MMPRPSPSLRGQTILAMIFGLLVSHAIAIAIYSSDRGDVITLEQDESMVEGIAARVLVMSEIDPGMRKRVAAASSTADFMVTVTDEPAFQKRVSGHALTAAMEGYLRSQLPLYREDRIILELDDDDAADEEAETWSWSSRDTFEQLFGGVGTTDGDQATHALRSSVQLGDGQWMNVVARVPVRGAHWPGEAGYSIVLVTCVALALSLWAVDRASKPLETFADAAERLGRDIEATPLPETGPREVIQAVRAFNAMQGRLKRLVQNRTQMLAAISHDLKTPVTLLRLRSELLEDEHAREKFIATLDDMSAMIESFLAFARSSCEHEPLRQVDVSALVSGVCDDLRSAGLPVDDDIEDGIVCTVRPAEVRRAVLNLIDNAIKYGERAHVRLRRLASSVEITVTDDGPGIPPDQIEQACTPFFRVESSRNLETGGVGLGLSTTQAILHGHGGELRLDNGAERGLIARATLPL